MMWPLMVLLKSYMLPSLFFFPLIFWLENVKRLIFKFTISFIWLLKISTEYFISFIAFLSSNLMFLMVSIAVIFPFLFLCVIFLLHLVIYVVFWGVSVNLFKSLFWILYYTMHTCIHTKSLQSCLTVIPWAVACQAPLSTAFCRQEYWCWVAMPFSRGSSQSRHQTCVSYVSCIGRWVLYHWRHVGSPIQLIILHILGFVELHSFPLTVSCVPDYLWFLNPCPGICIFEEEGSSSRVYTFTLAEKAFTSRPSLGFSGC